MFAVAEVPLDVLDHHDGIVNYTPDGNGEGTQSKDVQRVTRCRDADESDEQGQRDGDGGDQRGAHGHQENQNDRHREAQP
ncbi:hypothetical protein D3C73_1398980 [compost metagenome]